MTNNEEQKVLEFVEHTFESEIKTLDQRGAGVTTIKRKNKHGKVKTQKFSVPYTLPGERIRATIVPPYRKKIAKLDEVLEAHPQRIEAACPHFGRCGGCTWQHWTYEGQLKQKTNMVKGYLKEQGFDPCIVKDTLPAASEWGYRNKMEFTFAPDGSLGLHEQGNYRHIIPLKTCLIASDVMVDVTLEVARWAEKHQLPGYNKETHEGLLRTVLVRHSRATDEVMLAIFATERAIPETSELVKTITNDYPQVKSLLWLKNEQVADRAQADEIEVLAGREFIYDKLAGYTFRLWHDTFFQTNPVQAEKLVELALEMAQPRKDEKMIDLFCGVGTFSLPFADRVAQLAGIEIVETSVLSARRNAADNQVANTHFFTNDVRRGLQEVLDFFGVPDLFLLDPPRSGAGGKVMRRIARTNPGRIVYVSCNPQTFAQDVKELVPFGYELEKVQPVDLFPQTYHVELVALLKKVSK